MSLIKYTLDGKINLEELAIQRIRNFDPLQMGQDQPYYVAYSGGKDSDVIRILCQLAGVKHELWHNHTTVDAPETVRYVRSIPGMNVSMPDTTMWKLIVKNKIPPIRTQRYCCAVLKEGYGKDRFVMTGVRWSESTKRAKNRGSAELSRKIILNADNEEDRRIFETCAKKGKRIINPIIDWSDSDVWEFLRHYGCESNPLYQCGFKRIGCIGCPMSANQKGEFGRYPKYKQAYITSFDKMLKVLKNEDRSTKWTSAEAVYSWWVNAKGNKILKGQTKLEDDENDL